MHVDAQPTVRQIYALAAALCEHCDEPFPATRIEASELIERLRLEQGHPAPRVQDARPRPRSRRAGVCGSEQRGTEQLAGEVAALLAEELR